MRHQIFWPAFLAICLTPTITAQANHNANWQLVAKGGPEPRVGHAMAYDTSRREIVLFGGSNAGYGASPWPSGTTSTWTWTGWPTGTWVWDGASWNPSLSPLGPSPRQFSAMAFDSARNNTIMFGGIFYISPTNSIFILPAETLAWNGTTWSTVAHTGPAPRYMHRMVFDSARSRIVLFGGYRPPTGAPPGPIEYNDTWIWDGTSWTEHIGQSPPARHMHGMAYDSNRQRVIVYGGARVNFGGSSDLNDLWEWDGIGWMQVPFGNGPGGINSFSLSYIPSLHKTVLFGGTCSSCFPGLNDTWTWDGATWQQQITAGPSVRWGNVMVYSDASDSIIMFGGRDDSRFNPFGPLELDETWEYQQLVSKARSFGSGCGSPLMTVQPISGAEPRIGSSAQVAISSAPSPNLTFMALGLSRVEMGQVPLPFDLQSYGMPGCRLYSSLDAISQTYTNGISGHHYQANIPSTAALSGMHVFLQAFSYAPAANPGGTVVSNAVDWLIDV